MKQEIAVRFTKGHGSTPDYCIHCCALVNGFLFINHSFSDISTRALLENPDPVSFLTKEADRAITSTQEMLHDDSIIKQFIFYKQLEGGKVFSDLQSAVSWRFIPPDAPAPEDAQSFIDFLRGVK